MRGPQRRPTKASLRHSTMATRVTSEVTLAELPFLAAYENALDVSALFANERFAHEFWRALTSCSPQSRAVLLRILSQNNGILLKSLPATYHMLYTSAILNCFTQFQQPQYYDLQLLAIKVLRGMSFDENTASLICLSSATCEVIVRLCLQHARFDLKEAAIQLLLSWSSFPQVRLAFLENVQLINSLLEYGKHGAYSKEWILNTFVTLVSSLLYKTLEESNLVAWLVECAAFGETNRVRFLALACLYNMSLADSMHQVLVDRPAVFAVLIASVCGREVPEDAVLVALSALSGLASNRTEVQVRLGQNPELLQRLVHIIHSESNRSNSTVLKPALTLLLRLSYAEENEVSMFHHPFLVDSLLLLLKSHIEDEETRFLAIETLNNLCCSIENNYELFNMPYTVDTILRCAQSSTTTELRESAVVALQNFAYCAPSRVPLLRVPGLVDTLVHWVRMSPSPETHAAALGTLYALSMEPYNQEEMLRHRPLLFTLIDDAVSNDGENDLQPNNRAYLTLRNLGCSSAVIRYFRVMCVLCSVKDVPRIGYNSFVKVLPKELIWRSSQSLYPREEQQP